jgi:hypothetical protein
MAAPFMHCFVPPPRQLRVNSLLSAALRDGSVWSDKEMKPGTLGLEANVLTTVYIITSHLNDTTQKQCTEGNQHSKQ